MVERELLTIPEAEVVDVTRICGFFNSDIGLRLLKAKKVYREVPFNLKKLASEVIDSLKACDEELLIQGVIDCYFEEEGQLVLLDYKSDHAIAGKTDAIVSKYIPQLQLYEEALRKITGKAVKEKILYLFSLQEAILLE